jgi:hypothetical protein
LSESGITGVFNVQTHGDLNFRGVNQEFMMKYYKEKGIKAGTFELMFWTNFFMTIVSVIISVLVTKEFLGAYQYCDHAYRA